MSSNRFTSRVAIVTGSASGVGAAVARLLASRGAAVTVADINAEGAASVAEEIRAAGGTAMAVQVDVAEDDQVAEMVARTAEAFGRVDLLHNNAADLGPGLLDRDTDVIGVPLEVWDRTLAVSLRGPMLGCRQPCR